MWTTPSTMFSSLYAAQGKLAELEQLAQKLARHVDNASSSPARDIPNAVNTAKEMLGVVDQLFSVGTRRPPWMVYYGNVLPCAFSYLQLIGMSMQHAADKANRLSGQSVESIKDIIEKLTAGVSPSVLTAHVRDQGQAAGEDFDNAWCLFESAANVFLAVAENIYNNLCVR